MHDICSTSIAIKEIPRVFPQLTWCVCCWENITGVSSE